MEIIYKDKYKVLKPSNTNNYITDGNSIASSVIISLTDDENKWKEVADVSEENNYIPESDTNTLDTSKMTKIQEIIKYDKSDTVNSFTLGGNDMWLPLEERKSMRQSLIALKAQGVDTFTYWNGLTPITMPVSQFEAIMNAVEVYALQCFNNTAQHKANVMALTTIADVEAYDYTTDYPEKLAF